MKEIQFRNLSDISNQEIVVCFNTSFSDYVVPIQLSLKQLEIKLYSENIDKFISVGAFSENQLVGFILHGHRLIDGVRIAYNAGTGVIPRERGHGLTKRMYAHIKSVLNTKGFAKVVLEVISTNIPAIASYEKIGFKNVRYLSCFKGVPKIPKINTEITTTEVEQASLSDYIDFGDIKPTWQNTTATIERLGDAIFFIIASIASEVCGYCIVNRTTNRILQLAVKKDFRNTGVGTTLLNYLKNRAQGPISIINIDDRFIDTLRFFERRHIKKTLGQTEMELELEP